MSLRHSLTLLFAISWLGCADPSTSHGVSDGSQIGNAMAPPSPTFPQDGAAGPVVGNATSQPPPRDSGLGGLDASGGPSVMNDAGAYACTQNSDCQIVDVGSCCGYYPGCARVGTVFGAPDCSNGQVGQCSLPNIDHCACQQNVCVNVLSAVQGSMF